MSLMKKDFVDARHWIDEEEMLDLVAIAQSAPGAIAVNGAIVVGYKLAGILGAFVAIFGTVIPPFVIISILSVCYQAFRSNLLVARMLEGMQAGLSWITILKKREAFTKAFDDFDPSIDIRACSDSFISSCMQRGN